MRASRPVRREAALPRARRRIALAAMAAALLACGATRPVAPGIRNDRLAPCPSSPNCVSSDALDSGHRVLPLELRVPPEQAWRGARAAVAALPRTRIVAVDDAYLHAESTSAIFGFVDDLELHLRPDRNLIAVRSASRSGYSDLGANRRRVEALRADLERQGVLPR